MRPPLTRETYLAHGATPVRLTSLTFHAESQALSCPRTGHQLLGAALVQQETDTGRLVEELFITQGAGDQTSISGGQELLAHPVVGAYIRSTRHESYDYKAVSG